MAHIIYLSLLVVAADDSLLARQSASHFEERLVVPPLPAGAPVVVEPAYSNYAWPCIWKPYVGYYGRVYYGWYQRPPYNYRVQIDYPWHNKPILPPPPHWFEPLPGENAPEEEIPYEPFAIREAPSQAAIGSVMQSKHSTMSRAGTMQVESLPRPLRTLAADPPKRYVGERR